MDRRALSTAQQSINQSTSHFLLGILIIIKPYNKDVRALFLTLHVTVISHTPVLHMQLFFTATPSQQCQITQ